MTELEIRVWTPSVDPVVLLHQALLRQVNRGMAWIGAWGPNMGRRCRVAGVVARESRRPLRRGRRKS
jgi:hypothetical protein